MPGPVLSKSVRNELLPVSTKPPARLPVTVFGFMSLGMIDEVFTIWLDGGGIGFFLRRDVKSKPAVANKTAIAAKIATAFSSIKLGSVGALGGGTLAITGFAKSAFGDSTFGASDLGASVLAALAASVLAASTLGGSAFARSAFGASTLGASPLGASNLEPSIFAASTFGGSIAFAGSPSLPGAAAGVTCATEGGTTILAGSAALGLSSTFAVLMSTAFASTAFEGAGTPFNSISSRILTICFSRSATRELASFKRLSFAIASSFNAFNWSCTALDDPFAPALPVFELPPSDLAIFN